MHEPSINAGSQEFAQWECKHKVGCITDEVDDLVRNRCPENSQLTCLHRRATTAEQVSYRTADQQVQFDLVVSVRPRHADRCPQLARKTVGKNSGRDESNCFMLLRIS